MLSVVDALAGVTRLGLDTSPLIYFIEETAAYKPVLDQVFKGIITGQIIGVTSVVTLTEVLVQPLLKNETMLCHRYRDLILDSENLQVIPITAAIADRAAHLRAAHRLRTPDALQLSAAIEAGCEAFLTNDTEFKRVSEVRVLVLSDLFV